MGILEQVDFDLDILDVKLPVPIKFVTICLGRITKMILVIGSNCCLFLVKLIYHRKCLDCFGL